VDNSAQSTRRVGRSHSWWRSLCWSSSSLPWARS